MTPGIVCLVAAMTSSTLNPMSCPPSPGLAPWPILIWSSSASTRYLAVTPNLPDAICLTAERKSLPSGPETERAGSSPPSPVLLLDPMRFIASARVLWASPLMAPNDMAATSTRPMMDSAGSTSSRGTGSPSRGSSRSRTNIPRRSTAEVNLA